MALDHTVTWAQVRERAGLRLGAGLPDESAVQAEAERLLGLAVADLTEVLEDGAGNSVTFRPMPEEMVNECILTVAKAWADRKRTPGNNGQTTTVEDGNTRNIPRDTLAGVRPILARYTVGLA